MKKIVSTFLIIILICLSVVSCAADEVEVEEDVNIDLKFTSPVKIENNQKNVILTLELENVTGIPNDTSLGYQAYVDYDESIFESITKEKNIEALNNWEVHYNSSTKILECELVNQIVSTNTQIARFTFTIKDGAKAGDTTIKLKSSGDSEALITAQSTDPTGTVNYSKICEKTSNITIVAPKSEEPSKDEQEEDNQKEEQKEEQQEKATQQEEQGKINGTVPQGTKAGSSGNGTVQPQNNVQNNNTTKQDGTIAKTSMPKTGIKTIFFTLLILAVIGTIYLVRYKSIKLK